MRSPSRCSAAGVTGPETTFPRGTSRTRSILTAPRPVRSSSRQPLGLLPHARASQVTGQETRHATETRRVALVSRRRAPRPCPPLPHRRPRRSHSHSSSPTGPRATPRTRPARSTASSRRPMEASAAIPTVRAPRRAALRSPRSPRRLRRKGDHRPRPRESWPRASLSARRRRAAPSAALSVAANAATSAPGLSRASRTAPSGGASRQRRGSRRRRLRRVSRWEWKRACVTNRKQRHARRRRSSSASRTLRHGQPVRPRRCAPRRRELPRSSALCTRTLSLPQTGCTRMRRMRQPTCSRPGTKERHARRPCSRRPRRRPPSTPPPPRRRLS